MKCCHGRSQGKINLDCHSIFAIRLAILFGVSIWHQKAVKMFWRSVASWIIANRLMPFDWCLSIVYWLFPLDCCHSIADRLPFDRCHSIAATWLRIDCQSGSDRLFVRGCLKLDCRHSIVDWLLPIDCCHSSADRLPFDGWNLIVANRVLIDCCHSLDDFVWGF